MNRIDRLFGILTFLQSRKFVRAEKIAEKFKISLRTVYRDIRSLGEQGIPISFEQYKGYFIVQGYFLPPVSFSTEEANALLLMESVVAGFSDQSIRQYYSAAFGKIKSVLNHIQKENIDSLHQRIHFQLPGSMYPEYAYLSRLQQAISGKETIEIQYKKSSGETSLRLVEPIGLVFYAFAWHLIGWCQHRVDYRDFKVSRILVLKNTGIPFSKTDHIGLNEYVKKLPVNY